MTFKDGSEFKTSSSYANKAEHLKLMPILTENDDCSFTITNEHAVCCFKIDILVKVEVYSLSPYMDVLIAAKEKELSLNSDYM